MLYKIYKILPKKMRWIISYFYADKFLIGIVAFVRKNNQILLLKHVYQYPLALPGGFLKKGESINSAIQREIKEETGLDVKVNKVLEVKNGSKKPILDIVVDCVVVGGEIKIDKKEIETAEFYDINKLPLDDILYQHLSVIKNHIQINMPNEIKIKNAPIEDAVLVNRTIVEFDKPYQKEYFEDRYKGRDNLITVAYINGKPIGYVVWYDRDGDGSFYCWMAGVNPEYRRLGVLKMMMDYGFDWAKNKGYKKIKIKTRNSRREMLAYLVRYSFWFTNVVQNPDIADNRIELEKST